MVSVFLETLLTGYFMTDELMYFLLSFQTVLPWSVCPKDQNISCFNGTGANETGVHKAFAFWKYIYMENPVLNLEDIVGYEMPSIERIVVLVATWAMTFGIVCVSYYHYRKNLLGTIRPTEHWGPPDPEDRALRRMFNPRLETKYQAHKMVCEHCCLYGNKALKSIINQEDVMRREYLLNLVETKNIKVFLAEPEYLY
ncbi:dorsal-ventral patterning protein tolloid-related-related [Holotrichia oblita]|uniref:Dorsal-ventral patterning protein tolloid-related-related n=1 Tax=Holotrichia oblita TaxID=644536 RepID=A0ACB9TST1_HOLOL|nr:dorsal-ventral patterning protein tolloid-related-related [Holotrichia oblita]